MIHHVALRAEWEAAVEDGTYTMSSRGVTLADEGFIHCSYADQVADVLARYYEDTDDLVLLTIDETRLTSEVNVEHGFPHIYGPLNIDAVMGTEPVRGGSA